MVVFNIFFLNFHPLPTWGILIQFDDLRIFSDGLIESETTTSRVVLTSDILKKKTPPKLGFVARIGRAELWMALASLMCDFFP